MTNRPQAVIENDRLDALERYGLIDAPPDAIFNGIAQAAADLCETPIALITLFDSSRQWFRSCIGMDLSETSREMAFCAQAVLNAGEFMEVGDLTLDERFRDNPLVAGEPGLRFYAGQSLLAPDGDALGTLCVIDRKPRELSAPQRNALLRLADVIVNLLEDRRMAEERIASLGDVLEASINEIFIFDEATLRFMHVNQGARDNLGYNKDELLGMTPLDIKPEFTLDTFEQILEPLRTGKKAKIDFTTAHRRKNGTTYPVEIHLQRSTFDSTPVFAAIILDITERTQTAEALAQARLFLESAPDPTIIVNDAGKIEVANSQTAAMFGYSNDELRGMRVETLVPERFRDKHIAHREQYSVDPKVRGMGAGFDLFAATKNGDEIPIEVSLSPIRTGDGILVAAAIRDVTERVKSAQALQRAKDSAETATATKSRFLAAASHDLRQPLQSIGLYLSVLNQRLERSENQEIAGKIRSSLDVMGELLDALLDISKLDSGAIEPNNKDFCLQTLLDQLCADNEPHATDKGLNFRCEKSPIMVYSDPALLQRIVENFVGNAVRYTDTGSITIRCIHRGENVRIEIEDTGTGIPEKALDTIFEEYFQLDNPVRDRRKGLGLGLSIVKHIARLLDHPLDVVSVPGKGSTFAVEVPLGEAIDETSQPQRAGKSAKQSDREPIVLFVDDDPAIVDATTMLLNVTGFVVHSALNGDEALAHVAGGVCPDVLVSDYRLPGLTGIEVIRRVREATIADLPSVLMTGDTSASEIEAANLKNCTVLHKPVDTERLISLIEDATS